MELAARFEKLRGMLLTDRFEARLQNPLSYWTLPADRRLPRALMHRTLGDLLRTSFGSLAATPGIGHKKMHSLLQLLDRALHTDELEQERYEAVESPAAVVRATPTIVTCDAANISEVTWAKWRATIVEHGLENEPLGRFADTLHDLPRVIWNAPLGNYARLTLDEVRRLKTHGEKRVRAILTIFGRLYTHLVEQTGRTSLEEVTPAAMNQLNAWIHQAVDAEKLPTVEELRTQFIGPLVEQIRVDAGEATANLVLGRLAWEGQKLSVRRAAMKLRLTRARIYQLLEDAETVVAVRFPRGLEWMRSLLARVDGLPIDAPSRSLLTLAAEAFFASEFRPEVVPAPAFLRRFEPSSMWPTNGAALRPVFSPIPTGSTVATF